MFFQEEIQDDLVYKMFRGSPDGFRIFLDFYYDARDCPDLPDPYPFIIVELPYELREQNMWHPYQDGAPDYWKLIMDAGIDELVWREQPKHIDNFGVLSEDVFDTLQELAPGAYKSEYRFIAVGPEGRTRLVCHRVGLGPNSAAVKDAIVGVETYPSTEVSWSDDPLFLLPSSFRRREKAGVDSTVIEVARDRLPSGLFRIQGSFADLATPEFARAWQETDISKKLRAAYFEDDFYFAPFEPYKNVSVRLV